MKISFTHRITRLAAFALLSLCFLQTQVGAQPKAYVSDQDDDELALIFMSIPMRIPRGQTLRVSLGLDQEREAGGEVRTLVRLVDAQGNLIAQSAEVVIPSRGLRTIDFNGDALPQSGSVGQHEIFGAIVKINVVQAGPGSGQDQGETILQDARLEHMSLELIDNLTGETQVHINRLHLSGQTYQDVPPSDTFFVGLGAGQSLRLNVVGPDETLEPERRGVVFIQMTLFDESGAVIGNSDEIAIPPGESRSVDFNYDELSLAGRVQTRAAVRYRPFTIVDRTNLQVWPLLIELMDDATGNTRLLVSELNRTGGTTAVWHTSGFFEVIPPRNPQ